MQNAWETRSREEHLEGTRTGERLVAVLGYLQLSHLEEVTWYWVSLESVAEDQNEVLGRNALLISNHKITPNN